MNNFMRRKTEFWAFCKWIKIQLFFWTGCLFFWIAKMNKIHCQVWEKSYFLNFRNEKIKMLKVIVLMYSLLLFKVKYNCRMINEPRFVECLGPGKCSGLLYRSWASHFYVMNEVWMNIYSHKKHKDPERDFVWNNFSFLFRRVPEC